MQRRKFIQTAGIGALGSGLMNLSAARVSARTVSQNKPVTARQIVERIQKKVAEEGTKGLIWRSGDEVKFERPDFIMNLDELPFPAWHLLPMKLYKPSPANYRHLPAITMMTSRGCPFNCIFCHKPIFGRQFRPHSAERVVSEIQHLKKVYGIRDIQFFDDTFTLNKQRVKASQRCI